MITLNTMQSLANYLNPNRQPDTLVTLKTDISFTLQNISSIESKITTIVTITSTRQLQVVVLLYTHTISSRHQHLLKET